MTTRFEVDLMSQENGLVNVTPHLLFNPWCGNFTVLAKWRKEEENTFEKDLGPFGRPLLPYWLTPPSWSRNSRGLRCGSESSTDFGIPMPLRVCRLLTELSQILTPSTCVFNLHTIHCLVPGGKCRLWGNRVQVPVGWSEEQQDQLILGPPHSWRAHRDGKIPVGANGKTSNCWLLCPSNPTWH